MKVSIFGELNTFELFVLCTLIPAVFIYLWSLISGDMKVGPTLLSALSLIINLIFFL